MIARSQLVPPHVLVLAAIVSVQVGGALAATLIPHVGVGGTVWLRLVSASVVLLLFARPPGVVLRDRPRREWSTVLLFGAVLAVMNASFYAAIARLPLGVVVTVEFIGPLALAAVLSHRRQDVVAVAMAGLGVVFIARPGGLGLASVDLIGLLLALLAGACWAGYIVLAQRIGAAFQRLHGLTLAMIVAAVLTSPLGVSAGTRLVEPGILALGSAVGMLSTVVPYSLELFALRSLPAGVFGVLLSLEPAVAASAGWAILGQSLEPWQLAGMLLVVIASILTSRASTPPPVGGEHR